MLELRYISSRRVSLPSDPLIPHIIRDYPRVALFHPDGRGRDNKWFMTSDGAVVKGSKTLTNCSYYSFLSSNIANGK